MKGSQIVRLYRHVLCFKNTTFLNHVNENVCASLRVATVLNTFLYSVSHTNTKLSGGCYYYYNAFEWEKRKCLATRRVLDWCMEDLEGIKVSKIICHHWSHADNTNQKSLHTQNIKQQQTSRFQFQITIVTGILKASQKINWNGGGWSISK